MSDKFMDIYRIPSARLENWDYGWKAAYFVTICTAGREHYFGTITNGEMILSGIGRIAQQEWLKTPDIRPDMNIRLGEFVVMPNHIHGIIIIGKNQYNQRNFEENGVETQCIASPQQPNSIDQQGFASPQQPNPAEQPMQPEEIPTPRNKFAPQSKNLASIIRGFKSSVTIQSRPIHADFAWQSRFHEHIIRDIQSYHLIRKYIRNNPSNWENDQFYI